MARAKRKLEVDGGDALASDPFADLAPSTGAPAAPSSPTVPASTKGKPALKGRLDVGRVKGGRGGKTVTVIAGEALRHHNPQVRQALLKELQGTLGTGGTLKAETIELQGDHRDAARDLLTARGARVVFVGG